MKKFITQLLVICTFVYTFMPTVTLAMGLGQLAGISTEVQVAKNSENNGILELDVKFVLPIQNIENPNIQVKLKKDNNEATISLNQITTMKTLDFKLGEKVGIVQIRKMNKNGEVINGVDASEVKYYALTFKGLEKGKYSIELSGKGYKTYKLDDIEINNYSKRVSISNEKGLFEVGDINNDKTVDTKDLQEMKKILTSGQKYNEQYDLNRDGKLDIADLAIIARVVNDKSKTATIINTNANLTEEDIEISGNVDGNISDLLNEYSINTFKVKPIDESQDISESNPAQFTLNMKNTVNMEQIRLDVNDENIPQEICVEITDENGKNLSPICKSFSENSSIHFFTDKPTANTIVIDLAGQIAVKKVTIKITKTSSKKLADIAKVEFLNNVYEDVPTPKIEKPKNVKVEAASEKATVTWQNMQNVTGFEVLVQKLENGQITENITYQTNYTTFALDGLKNYVEYVLKVRAVNGEWRSDYSDEVSFMPKPNRLPPAVDMVKVVPASNGFNISYKKMDDTLTYNIYYREAGIGEFIKISNITGTSYQLRGLKEKTKYEIYVTGNNDLGEGAKSETAIGTTRAKDIQDSPNYKLINTPNKKGEKVNHIAAVNYTSNKYNASDIALVDNDYDTYWQSDSWDVGGYNNYNAGPTITLDKKYTIDRLEITPKDDTASIFYARVNYWTDDNQMKTVNASVKRKTSPNGEIYYDISFAKITASKIQINTANYSASGNTVMREIRIFEYDSLLDDVGALFADDLRVELKENVTENTIKALEDRANTVDPVSKEYHPNREVILSDLDYARKILNDTAIQDTIIVDQNISNAKNGHLGFAMSINDYQPLGVVAEAGSQLVIYVGTKGSVLPQIVFTQYNAEASQWQQSVTNLKKGQNIITVPKIGSMDKERGGSVYLRYPSSKASSEIKVRVSGGTKIPVLDIHNVTSEEEKKQRITDYIKELSKYVDSLPSLYQEKGIEYDQYNAILNSTELVTKNGLLSVAATQALAGIKTGKNTIEEQQIRLYNSMTAFDEMVDMFYRQKGLKENATDPKDERPAARINIRYMRMFDGAFMYAGGLHIGIGYGSISGLMQGTPAQNNNGDYTINGYFGWGISHEIGHQINQGSLAVAEITNNVFALLAQTADDKQTARIEYLYETIYKKVTSGTKGKASNVFVSLGMYWQLHLAYDNNKTFTDENSIYARINHLARTKSLKGSKDDLLVMLASEAANKNLTEFFENWGLQPSEAAKEYASKFEKETRKIWYLNDTARRYRLNNGRAKATDTTVSATLIEADSQNKRYTLNMSVNKDNDTILGYEIKRNGVPIAFTQENTFTDNIGSMNNQAITYEVTAYDKLLNATNTYTLNEVKVAHDGSVNKANFDITSNFIEQDETIDHENPEMDYNSLNVNKLIDANANTTFNGSKRANEKDKTNPYVVIGLNSKLDIAGIKYQPARNGGSLLENTITKYNVYVSKDNANWTLAKTGTFNFTNNKESNTIYFDKVGTTGGNQLWTYEDISYVKIEAVGNTGISGAEIDIIAPPGDNVEASRDTIGILSEDYHYIDGNGNDAVIAKGNVIVKGDYRGNPAFNVMLLVDAVDSEKVYEGENFLFAQLNSDAEVHEIASGTWFYVLTKEQYKQMEGTSIRAELYRVNDAVTNEGQRLTSTSLKITNLPAYEDLNPLEIVDSTKGE